MAYDDPNEPWPGFNAPRDAADAVMRERVRADTILDSAEGKRYPTMARSLVRRGMPAAEAISLLGEFDAENPAAAAGNPYLKALEKEATFNLGGPGPAIGGDPKAARRAELRQVGKQLGVERGYRT